MEPKTAAQPADRVEDSGDGPRIPNGSSPGETRPDPAALLRWYDRHARVLPWRARPGERADPYRVWLSEIMLQQTTVKAVAPYFARFLARWPRVQELAAAPLDDVLGAWAGLGYYARARNLHVCAQAVVERHGGRFPADLEALRALPGVGDYTAGAIAAIAFDMPAAAVDGNVERVVARLFAVETPLPAAKPVLRRLAADLVPAERPGDFAQAMMDLGATICTPRKPACALCPWRDPCRGRASGQPERYPLKAAKAERPLRRGAAFVLRREDGAILVRRRPLSGLLGGMLEVPTTDWSPDFRDDEALHAAPVVTSPGASGWSARWERLAMPVTHVFTHFPLELTVYRAVAPADAAAPEGAWWLPAQDIAGAALPNVMRKVLAAAAA